MMIIRKFYVNNDKKFVIKSKLNLKNKKNKKK